jgi:hypothetical protein
MGMTAFLYFHFREEHRGGDSGHGHASAFRTAHAIEDVLLIAGGDDSS